MPSGPLGPTPMDDSKLEAFTVALETFLRERFKYKTQSTTVGLGPTMTVSRDSVKLYLRFKPNHYSNDLDRPLVIAAVQFKRQQQGHGTALLNFLVDHADEFGLGTVALESTNIDSAAFAKKRGFIEYPAVKNAWQISIEDLRTSLISKKLRHCAIN